MLTNSKLVERTFIIFARGLDCCSASARERNRSPVICVLSSLLSSPPPNVAALAERLGWSIFAVKGGDFVIVVCVQRHG